MSKPSVEKTLAANIEKAVALSHSIYDNVIDVTANLSQVDSIIVKKAVTSAHVVATPGDFEVNSVGRPKSIASYDTMELARAGDITKAKTLTEYIYPDEDTVIIIERR